jgi:hypothetical protein
MHHYYDIMPIPALLQYNKILNPHHTNEELSIQINIFIPVTGYILFHLCSNSILLYFMYQYYIKQKLWYYFCVKDINHVFSFQNFSKDFKKLSSYLWVSSMVGSFVMISKIFWNLNVPQYCYV